MLVLTRRTGQAIKVGSYLTIKVVCATNGKVRLGIEAPRFIPVLRDELIEKQVAKEIRQSALQEACHD